MSAQKLSVRLGFSLLLLLLPAGCAGMVTIPDVLSGGGLLGQEVRGEIGRIDTRRSEIEVRSDRGRSEWVEYDRQTEVLHRQRRQAVRNLRAGDLVSVRVDRRPGRAPYARRIQVQQTARERTTSTPIRGHGVERMDGTISRMNSGAGWFDLQIYRGSTVRVTLPYAPPRSVRDRFNRLRRGDAVRIEGEWLNPSRVELRRFL